MLLIWAVWVVLNLWIWQKSKSNGNLVMLVGAGFCTVSSLMGMLSPSPSMITILMIGLVVLTIGFYISVKPMVAAQIAALQAKMKSVTDGKPGGGAPPAP